MMICLPHIVVDNAYGNPTPLSSEVGEVPAHYPYIRIGRFCVPIVLRPFVDTSQLITKKVGLFD